MAIYTHYEVANSPSTSWWSVMGSSYTFNQSLITFTNTDGTLTKAHGSFVIVNNDIVAGFVTSMQHTSANGQTVYEDITGLAREVNAFLSDDPISRLYYAMGGNDTGYGYSGDDHMLGGQGHDALYGGYGDDYLDGNEGPDTMVGGYDNDTYRFDPSDTVIESADGGYDIADMQGSGGTLPDNVEAMIVNTAFTTHYGNGLDNYIEVGAEQAHVYGGGGNDTFVDLTGHNSFYGGLGDDEYRILADDTVVELANEGYDVVWSALATYTLPDNVEKLILLGGAKPIGIGNDLDNVFNLNNGTAGAEIHGMKGNDKVYDNTGDSLIDGGEGDDTAVYDGKITAFSPFDRGDKILLSKGSGHDEAVAVEHLQFKDGTVNLNDGNPLFDTVYYMLNNLDVFHAGANALDHFNANGWHEGRDPNAFFDTSGYLALNKDVAAAGANPLEHYHQSGWKEGRDPSANFDTKLYLVHNPDVAAAGVDPLAHYLAHGMAEGRQTYAAIGQTISNGFDAEYYLFHNPDVAAAGVDPLAHFNANGWHEGRNPNAYFDTAGYLSHYADVAAAGVNPLAHYMNNGWQEGRDASAMFDTAGYLAANPDVAAAGVNPLQHYLQFGIYEGRALGNDGVWG